MTTGQNLDWLIPLWDPQLAVEEVLRRRSVVQAIPRKAVRDVVLADTEVAAGEVVYAVVAAANRDPARWVDADRFHVGRPHQPHLGVIDIPVPVRRRAP
jgi:cytochrome P450